MSWAYSEGCGMAGASTSRWAGMGTGMNTQDYRTATTGTGPYVGVWRDQPRRLILDLCDYIDKLDQRLADQVEPVARMAALHDLMLTSAELRHALTEGLTWQETVVAVKRWRAAGGVDDSLPRHADAPGALCGAIHPDDDAMWCPKRKSHNDHDYRRVIVAEEEINSISNNQVWTERSYTIDVGRDECVHEEDYDVDN